jgi:hypothetical protein
MRHAPISSPKSKTTPISLCLTDSQDCLWQLASLLEAKPYFPVQSTLQFPFTPTYFRSKFTFYNAVISEKCLKIWNNLIVYAGRSEDLNTYIWNEFRNTTCNFPFWFPKHSISNIVSSYIVYTSHACCSAHVFLFTLIAQKICEKKMRVTKPLILNFPLSRCYLFPVRYKYSCLHPVLNTLNLLSVGQKEKPTFTIIKNR